MAIYDFERLDKVMANSIVGTRNSNRHRRKKMRPFWIIFERKGWGNQGIGGNQRKMEENGISYKRLSSILLVMLNHSTNTIIYTCIHLTVWCCKPCGNKSGWGEAYNFLITSYIITSIKSKTSSSYQWLTLLENSTRHQPTWNCNMKWYSIPSVGKKETIAVESAICLGAKIYIPTGMRRNTPEWWDFIC